MSHPVRNIYTANPKKQKAIKALKAGKFSEARTLLSKVCKSDRNDAEAWFLLSSANGQLGDMHAVIQCCKHVLALQPNHANALSNMGNAQASLGQHGNAAHSYEKALQLKAGDPSILNNLGNALALAGDTEKAAETLKQVTQLRPNYADAHNNLGNIYKSLNKNEEAVIHFQEALKLKPDLFEALLNLGSIYSDRIGHPEAAEDCFRKALKLKPDNIEAHSGLINMLRFQGRLQEALEAIDAALTYHPHERSARAAMADIYERQGRYDEALDLVNEIQKEELPTPQAVDVLIRLCRHFGNCDEAIKQAEDVLANTPLTSFGRQMLHFSLGRLLDKQNNYDAAFQHYYQGNEINKPPYDPQEHTDRISRLISSFTSETMQRYPRAVNATDRPVFIVGMPRSGTSLTEQILSSHEKIHGAGELNYINDIVAAIGAESDSGLPFPECLQSISQQEIESYSQQYLNQLGNFSTDAQYVTDKMPHNFINLGIINLLFPESRIIHCVRDARDTCLSIYFQNFGWLHRYGSDLHWLGMYHREYERLMHHWKAVLDIPILDVRYEDMIADQENTTRNILEFCGLEWDERCLDFHKSKRVVATASYDQVREKIYTRSSQRWRNYQQHLQPLLDSLEHNNS